MVVVSPVNTGTQGEARPGVKAIKQGFLEEIVYKLRSVRRRHLRK